MRKVTLALVPLLLVACDRQTNAPEFTPSYAIDNAPDFTGIVVRDQGPAGVNWGDPVRGMRITIGYDPVDECLDPANYTDYDLLIWADKFLPTDRDNSLNQWKDARIAVWSFFPNDCALFTTLQPLATGYGDASWLDNDYFGSSNPNSNVWGAMVHGTLTSTADGSTMQVSGHYKFLWDKKTAPRIVTRAIILQ
jgi:hypothetical protein